MCQRVEEIREALGRIVADLRPDAVPLSEAPGLWQAFDGIERLAGAAKVLLARKVEESGVWRHAGYASAAEYLAARSGSALGKARSDMETSKKIKELPATEDAMRKGALSGPQAEAIAGAASVNRKAEDDLLKKAKTASLGELRDECQRAKAKADPNPDATRERIHKERRLRRYVDGEGAWNLVARGTTDDGAAVTAALEPIVDELFRAAWARGERQSREAYAFDALIELARRVRGGGDPETRRPPTYLALLRLDLEALIRGAVEGEELCEITGLGPVPVRTARQLLGDAVLKLVLTRGVDVANVTHLGRGPSAAQRIALLWDSPICTVEGCGRTRLEADHRIPWTETHHTRLDELDALCHHHHDLKTRLGWAVVEGTGKRPMVPPDDPRHPASRPPPGRPPRGRPRPESLFDGQAA